MLTGYDSIKNLHSVSANPILLLEWNANKFAEVMVAGTTNKPTNATLKSSYLFTNGTTIFDTVGGSTFNTTVSTYTSTAYNNILATGMGSVFSDNTYQVIKATNTLDGTDGYNSPIEVQKTFTVDSIFKRDNETSINDSQEYYSILVSFWVKSTYCSTNLNVTPDFNIFVNLDLPVTVDTKSARIASSRISSTKHSVNSSDWTQVNIEFTTRLGLGTSPLKFLRVKITSDTYLDSYPEFAIDDFQILRVSRRQTRQLDSYSNPYDLFKVNRPGEYLVRYKEDGLNLKVNQSCHSTPKTEGFIVGSDDDYYTDKSSLYDEQFIDTKNFSSYMTEQYSEDTLMNIQLGSSEKIWALYQKQFSVNKIVIKQNNNLSYSPLDVYILTKSGSDFTWSLAGTVSPVESDNGIGILYYNVSTLSWSTTKWTVNPNIDSGAISNSINICGIYVEPNNRTTRTVGAAWKIPSNFDLNKSKLQFVEISPRLQLDLTSFLKSYNIAKELANDSDSLPIGQATSNSLNVTLSNIPLLNSPPDAPTYSTNNDVVIFNNESETSPIKSLLKKDCQCFLYLNINSSRIPQFSGYVDSWNINEDSVTANAYDVIKLMQDRVLSATKKTINDCPVNTAIGLTLRSAGINDFSLADLNALTFINNAMYKSNRIQYYWIEKDENASEAIDELAKIYQILMYSDEYGKIVINSLSKIMKSSTIDLTITDIPSGTDYLSNIESVSELAYSIPKVFSINYTIANPATINTSGNTVKNPSTVVWQPESELITLSNLELAETFSIGQTSLKITNMDTFLNGLYDYSGYLLIDREIISYNGIEHNIRYQDSAADFPNFWYSYKGGLITIYSQENLNFIQNLILASSSTVTAVSIKKNGVLKNIQRGLFGTIDSNHGANVTLPNATVGNLNPLSVFDDELSAVSMLSTTANSGQNIQYGVSFNNIIIPSNKHIHIDRAITTVDKAIPGWNYFKTVQTLNNSPAISRAFTGIYIGGNIAGTDGLYIGVGNQLLTGKYQQSIIIKNWNANGLKNHMTLSEEDFGTNFINPAGPNSQAITFEVFLRNYGTGTSNAAQVFINGTLISSSAVFAAGRWASVKSGVQFTTDNYLTLFSNELNRFGIFTYSPLSNVPTTTLHEISFSNKASEINYIGETLATQNEEKALMNKIINNIDPENLKQSYDTTPSYAWTGLKSNARQMKIFDVDANQYPLQAGTNKFFQGSYSYEFSTLKTNYI